MDTIVVLKQAKEPKIIQTNNLQSKAREIAYTKDISETKKKRYEGWTDDLKEGKTSQWANKNCEYINRKECHLLL